MIAGLLAEAERVLGLPPDLALALLGGLVLVLAAVVVHSKPRWK